MQKTFKIESGCLISKIKGRCLKRQKELVFIKSQGGVDQGLGIERFTILNEKSKTESLFYIKSQNGVFVSRNRKTYHSIKDQNRKLTHIKS